MYFSKKLLFFLYAITVGTFVSSISVGQTITTVAGNGLSGYTGDGGMATSANITASKACAIDKFGNMYFVSGSSNRIRKVDVTGLVHTIAGLSSAGFEGDGGPASLSKLKYPYDLAIDTFGNIYIADHLNYRIRKINAITNVITTIAGNGIAASTGDGGPATSASIIPYALCVDNSGNVYLIDNYGTKVRKVDISGNISTIAGTGTGGYTGDGGPAISANLSMNYGICTDNANNIFIACDTRVRKIDMSTGLISTIAGTGSSTYTGDGISALSASFNAISLSIDNHDNLYISDIVNDRVYKITPAGIFHLIAGTGVAGYNGDGIPANTAQLYNPEGIAVDKCGNIYIGDGGNYRIRKITYSTTGIAGIGITVLPNDTVCAGTAVTYSATLTDSSTTGYQWYKNGAPITGATNRTYTYTPTETGDDIHCVYTGIDVCSIAGHPASNTIHMVVTPLTVPTISLGGSTAAPLGSTVTVTATVGGAGSSYSIGWYRNGLPLATTTVPTVTYTKTAGTDAITTRLSSTDAVGCYDTTTSATHTVLVGPNEVNDVAPQAMAVTISPNPARTVLHIDGAVHTWRIMGVTGAVLLQGGPLAGHTIMVQDLPAGMYYIELCHPTGQHTLHRFVKE